MKTLKLISFILVLMEDIGLKFKTAPSTPHCGVSKTQRKWFYDKKRDGLDDEIRRN